MKGELEVQRHIVVFDCNVYLDVARLMGSPVSWARFDSEAARSSSAPLPNNADRAVDSLRALAVCTSGKFAGEEVLEVWTSTHIERIVRSKAQQSAVPDPSTGLCGLGWSQEQAEELCAVLVDGLRERSGGGDTGVNYPEGNPPLDHEDGMVYGCCAHLASDDPLARTYCVTRDRGFLQAFRDGRLPTHTTVLTPAQFVALVRRARASYSIKRMLPGS